LHLLGLVEDTRPVFGLGQQLCQSQMELGVIRHVRDQQAELFDRGVEVAHLLKNGSQEHPDRRKVAAPHPVPP